MVSSKGNNVPTLGMYLALAVSSAARRDQYVDLHPAVQQEIWHAQETVRITAPRFFAFLFRSHVVVLQAALMF